MKRLFLLLSVSVLLLQGCFSRTLNVDSYPIDKKHLASNYAGTPDHRNEGVYIGQRLVVRWSLPKDMFATSMNEREPLTILFTIRFGDNSEEIITRSVQKVKGSFEYVLRDEDYIEHKGIYTYMAKMFMGSKVVKEWSHQMWVDYIELDAGSSH